ncbi:Bud-site selection protein [Pisolithus croceorrhizus]|nr:Bud-site selection protein [Pisolithus croceorrhizus]KAI6166540.1 Bud-site selection protein [Pisolithus thermaeus]
MYSFFSFNSAYATFRHDDPTGEGTKDLEQQLEALKHLDCKQIANTALTTKIKKDKKLSEHPLVQSAVLAELTSSSVSSVPSGTPTAKAQSRVLSSKLLAAEIVTVLEALRNYLSSTSDMGEMPNQKGTRGSASGRKDKDRTSSPVSTSDSDSGEGHRGQDSEERVATEDDGWQSGTVSDEPSAADGWESGRVHDNSDYDKLSDDVTDFGDQTTSLNRTKVQTRKLVSLSKDESVFLPTLSVGFARGGGSDSEFSDSEANVADGVKKNRRGQRARRAIWEKKYGKNARHLKKRQEITQGTKQLSSTSRGQRTEKQPAVSRPDRKHDYDARMLKQTSVDRPMSDRPMRRGASTRTDPPRTRQEQRDERPLHPSWEAKKKQKKIGIVPSQGTKIIFDP